MEKKELTYRSNDGAIAAVINVDEIAKLQRIESNRCNFSDYDEAAKHAFSRKDVDDYNRRVQKIANSMKKHGGWLESEPLTVFKSGNDYLIEDGQGRIGAIDIYNNWAVKNHKRKIREIPVYIVTEDRTRKHIAKCMRVSNTTGTKWTTAEGWRNFALEEGGEYKDAYELAKKITEEIGFKGMNNFFVKLLLFGYHGTSYNKIENCKMSNVHRNYELHFNTVKAIYEECKKANWTVKDHHFLFKASTGQALYSHFVRLAKHADDYGLNLSSLFDEYTKRVASKISALNTYEISRIFTGSNASVSQALDDLVMKGLGKTNPIRLALLTRMQR